MIPGRDFPAIVVGGHFADGKHRKWRVDACADHAEELADSPSFGRAGGNSVELLDAGTPRRFLLPRLRSHAVAPVPLGFKAPATRRSGKGHLITRA